MSKQPYVELIDAAKVDYTRGRQEQWPCGSSQTCKLELAEGVSCASGCEYHQNYLKAKGLQDEPVEDTGS